MPDSIVGLSVPKGEAPKPVFADAIERGARHQNRNLPASLKVIQSRTVHPTASLVRVRRQAGRLSQTWDTKNGQVLGKGLAVFLLELSVTFTAPGEGPTNH